MDEDSRLKLKIRQFLVAQISKEKAVTKGRHENAICAYEWKETWPLVWKFIFVKEKTMKMCAVNGDLHSCKIDEHLQI